MVSLFASDLLGELCLQPRKLVCEMVLAVLFRPTFQKGQC